MIIIIYYVCVAATFGHSLLYRQGLWIGGRPTPPGPEGSNGNLTSSVVALWRLFFAFSSASVCLIVGLIDSPTSLH